MIDKFEVWKEYENIAMHFNTLLIQLRMRALGGVAIVVALISFIGKSEIDMGLQLKIYGFSFLILSVAWIAIFLIDYFYYNKLLLGAVKSTINLEAMLESEIKINFSTDVKEYVENEDVTYKNLWAILFFYVSVLILLMATGIYCLYCVYNVT